MNDRGEVYVEIDWSDNFKEEIIVPAIASLLFRINQGHFQDECMEAVTARGDTMLNTAILANWHVLGQHCEKDNEVVDPTQVFGMGRMDDE